MASHDACELATHGVGQGVVDVRMAAMQRFLGETLGLQRCLLTRWEWKPEVRDTPRHFASTSRDGKSIWIAPDLLRLPEEHREGILRHEWGHVVDFLYPAGIRRVAKDHVELQPPSADTLLRWRARDTDAVEADADHLASALFGRPLLYTGPCHLQAFRGSPRPPGLR